jgi:hypothetical protein
MLHSRDLAPGLCCAVVLCQGLDGVQRTFDAVLVGADRARGKWHRHGVYRMLVKYDCT